MSSLAPVALEMCNYIVSAIVDDKEAVEISESMIDGGVVQLDVRVAQGELGRVIGKRGWVANAIRSVVLAAGSRDNREIRVEFVD